ncbi:MAG: pantoate--beta-alanine ligase [Gammaproteobacteria bacterium]|nr:pantoate--beta-alanine ligase [Gammaproteobacteria bacterium]MYD76180.1 pantoate--beta-alanine ligase [Gammaproteobacteria bacterium]
MKVLSNPRDARTWCASRRQERWRIGYVPTMGALHEGHLSLLERSVMETDRTCASIFVNPLQFNDPRDLESYPETLQSDLEMLESRGCHMTFTGTLGDFFPEADDPELIGRIDPGPCASDLEGAHRPGHLEGVATIVDRLFRTVGSCRAYFGEKDFQQTLVVRHLCGRLEQAGILIDIIPCPTVRDAGGLALSSRNRSLSAAQRETATIMYRALSQTRTAWRSGVRNRNRLSDIMRKHLEHPEIAIEYAAVRNPDDWNSNDEEPESARGLAAIRIGGIRLIDNLSLSGEYEIEGEK